MQQTTFLIIIIIIRRKKAWHFKLINCLAMIHMKIYIFFFKLLPAMIWLVPRISSFRGHKTYANSEVADKPVHPHSAIRNFNIRSE